MVSKRSKICIWTFLIFLAISAVVISGCLTPSSQEYGTVRYDGAVYQIGNITTVTPENLDPDKYYPFFKNSFNSIDGYLFVNGNGQVFENLENNYGNYPIELTLYNDGAGLFDWEDWFENVNEYGI